MHLHPTNLHSSLLAKCDLRAKQVLIDKAPNAQSHDIVRSSEADILAKANEAIKKMSITDSPLPHPSSRCKETPKRSILPRNELRNLCRGTLKPMLTSDFIRNFDTTSTIKPNNYPIIAEFVPTSFNPTSKEGLTMVELANSLQPGDITTVRWITLPEKRTINQSTTHLILHL